MSSTSIKKKGEGQNWLKGFLGGLCICSEALLFRAELSEQRNIHGPKTHSCLTMELVGLGLCSHLCATARVALQPGQVLSVRTATLG